MSASYDVFDEASINAQIIMKQDIKGYHEARNQRIEACADMGFPSIAGPYAKYRVGAFALPDGRKSALHKLSSKHTTLLQDLHKFR